MISIQSVGRLDGQGQRGETMRRGVTDLSWLSDAMDAEGCLSAATDMIPSPPGLRAGASDRP